MVILRIENQAFKVDFRQAISLEKSEPTYFYGCPEHQIKAESFCKECNKLIRSERIYFKEPTEKVRLDEVEGVFTDTLPLYAMVENGFGWVIGEEKLRQLLLEKKQFIQFKFIEKGGLNARELDNFLFLFRGYLARIRCDLEHKKLIDYEVQSRKREAKRRKSVNVLKKEEPIEAK